MILLCFRPKFRVAFGPYLVQCGRELEAQLTDAGIYGGFEF